MAAPIAKRYREVGAALARDVSPGGLTDNLTEAQKQLIRSAAGLVILREALDVAAVNNEPVNVERYCAISNTLRRLLATIGLQRVPKDVMSLKSYIAQIGDTDDDGDHGADVEDDVP
jgi:hypothetical protein